jgi:ATP-dependent DNA helicase RecG
MNKLATPLSDIKGIGPQMVQRLEKLGIVTVKDLLYHLPFRYQDFSTITPVEALEEEGQVTVHGEITALSMSRTPRKKMWVIRATITDDTGKLKVIWFNQKYIMAQLKKGMSVNVAGKVTFEKDKPTIMSPVFEIISKEGQHTRHTGRIVPVYPETRGITSRAIRLALSKVVDYIEDVDEFLPEDVLEHHHLPLIHEAFSYVHFPESLDDAYRALDRFSFQDLFLLQLLNANEQYKLTQHSAPAFSWTPDTIKHYFSYLPFELTTAQKKALKEILEDLASSHPTSRLLQGDVGSGKTVVVAIAALVVASHNYQTVFMAPTEVLATQHYQTFTTFFEEFEGGVALLTSSHAKAFFGEGLEREYSKQELLEQIRIGSVSVVIGTHAVIQKNVAFKNLGFVIIDEQHRFGVKQRAKLLDRGLTQIDERTDADTDAVEMPHFLSMSATPIPRTLALTAFGDLDLSLINELPKNRKPIVTKVVGPSQRTNAYEFIREKVAEGRQVFVICPRIDPPEDDIRVTKKMLFQLETKSVKEEYDKLSKKIFPNLEVEMLHGRMKAKEKNDIMERFKNGDINVLVSTSVIEVGVDVPNATVMMIEGSERFGLSQLYQFRGRVGRGEHQSYCFLFTESKSSHTQQRLKSLVTAKNGFELAEMDLKFRGPGQFLGKEQTGMPDLAMKAIQNPELLSTARTTAQDLMKKDPTLAEYPALATYLKLFEQQVHRE